ncbi:MAG: hypothetical protein ACLR8Y_10775 [Alistipes indistinctus]
MTFTSSIDIYTRQIVAELLSVQITRPEYVSCPCPKCREGQVRLYPKAAKCSDPDCALLLFRNINGRTLTDEEGAAARSFGGGKTPYLKFISRKSGKPYLAALSLDEYALALEFKEKRDNSRCDAKLRNNSGDNPLDGYPNGLLSPSEYRF